MSESNELKPEAPELLPCPFCGSAGVIEQRASFSVRCSNLDCVLHPIACTSGSLDRQRLVRAWNSRTSTSGNVYVLIALDEDARVRECVVLTDTRQASELFQKLRGIWGGANVAMASRRIDALPMNLHEKMESVTEIIQ